MQQLNHHYHHLQPQQQPQQPQQQHGPPPYLLQPSGQPPASSSPSKRKYADYHMSAMPPYAPEGGLQLDGEVMPQHPPGLHPILAGLGIGLGLPASQNPYLQHQQHQHQHQQQHLQYQPQHQHQHQHQQQYQHQPPLATAPQDDGSLMPPTHSYPNNDNPCGPSSSQDAQMPQPPVVGKEKKPRKKRERKKTRKEKEDPSKPKVLFQGSRFELWLETRFEEELLKFFKVPDGQILQFSANLVPPSSTTATKSWQMQRSEEERIYKDKWRKRYHVYSADVINLVSDSFNFHIRIKNADTGDYTKLPFIPPMNSPISAYSNYLSLLGGAKISPGDDHCGYPPGEVLGEDACTLYEGSDVSFVLVGRLVGDPPAPPAQQL